MSNSRFPSAVSLAKILPPADSAARKAAPSAQEVEESKRIRDVMLFFDENEDGQIDLREFKDALGKLKVDLSDQRAEAYFREADKDRSGTIDTLEFQDLAQRLLGSHKGDDETEAMFRILCPRFPHKIRLHSLARMVRAWDLRLTSHEVETMFMAADVNEDNNIDLEEFKEVLRRCADVKLE